MKLRTVMDLVQQVELGFDLKFADDQVKWMTEKLKDVGDGLTEGILKRLLLSTSRQWKMRPADIVHFAQMEHQYASNIAFKSEDFIKLQP
jgi:hypothetical protein